MKVSTFFILGVLLISCKKEDEKPKRTTHELKIVYRSEDPTGMNVWLTATDAFYFNEHKNMSEYIFLENVKTGQNIQGSVSSPSGNWKTIIVIFNSDTIYNVKSHSSHAFNIDI